MAISDDWQFEISGLTIGSGTRYGIVSVSGIHSIQGLRVGDHPRPVAHGVILGDDFLEGRTVQIEVHIRGDSADDARAKLETLAAAWHQHDTSGGQPLPLTFRLPGRDAQRLIGRPRGLEANIEHLKTGRARVLLRYFAADPFLYSDQLATVTASLAVTTGGRTYPRLHPYTYTTAQSGTVQATNEGTVPAPVTASIHGPATHPRLRNVTLDRTLRIDITLAAGETLEVDLRDGTVTLDGVSRYDTVVQPAQWWDLAPGTNELRFLADSFDPAASCTFSWRSAWI